MQRENPGQLHISSKSQMHPYIFPYLLLPEEKLPEDSVGTSQVFRAGHRAGLDFFPVEQAGEQASRMEE